MDSINKPRKENFKKYGISMEKENDTYTSSRPSVSHSSQSNNQRTNTREKFVKHISLKAVIELKNKHPEQIVLELLNPRFGFENYLNEKISEELILNLTFVILKSLECNSMSIKLKEITTKIIESNFFTKHLYDSILTQNRKTNTYKKDLIELTVKLITELLIIDAYNVSKLSAIKDRLEILIYNRINSLDLKDLFQQFVKQEKMCLEKIDKRKNKTFTNIITDFEPQDDFTTMNIVPNLNDILVDDQEIFLRKNITNGSYKDVHHYLDVQFRLLREDFMKPLRNGVCEFRKIVHGSGKKLGSDLSKEMIRKIKKIENLNAYFDILLSNSIASDKGIVFEMQLDKEKIKSINWAISKRLIFGSLVCFSSDYFLNECLIGVVCERDEKRFKEKSCFNVKFNYDSIQLNFDCIPEFKKKYIMLETSAFFESYKHVLKALQSFQREGEENFPFKENFVYCQNRNLPIPKYLKEACIDFRILVDEKPKLYKRTELDEYEFSESVDYAKKCYISNEATWPSAEQMRLDELQYEAVKHILKNKLALIQGPPGTGKTFLGVKTVQLLLDNKHAWWNKAREKNKPILMICYTNHALDQFLEYCIRECNLTKGIVRIGGRSKSESLEPYFLKNVKQTIKNERNLDRNIHHGIIQQSKRVYEIKNKINNLNKTLNSIYFGGSILSLKQIENFMSKNHLSQLFDFSFDLHFHDFEDDYYLINWLGLLGINQYESLNADFDQLDLTKLKKIKINIQQNVYKDQDHNDDDDDDYDDDNNNDEANERAQSNTNDIDNVSLNQERVLEFDLEEPEFVPEFFNSRDIEDSSNSILDIKILEKMVKNFKELKSDMKDQDWKIREKGKIVDLDTIRLEKTLEKIFSHLTKKYTEIDIESLENTTNIWELSYPGRFFLYFNWVNKYIASKQEDIYNLSNCYNQAAAALQEIRLQEDRYVMEEALIIAMTTTGSSRYHSILKDIGPRIVIVEEAAEVFEAHIVSSLSKHCEHLILIGDHVQLRPNPAVYNLATQYHLDVSLFERLINNNTKRVMLNNQHRMRPEISILMKHFYDRKINDNWSVLNYPNIKGLKKNVFFIEHSEPERRLTDNNTKINSFEANYLSKLCMYITKQDYDESKITVLSMYLGQTIEIRRLLRKMGLLNVKVSTVDNYQGEENDIVLLSLVRSNPDQKIGFLNIKNRVCVAMSRARHGFYVIGNFKFICDSEKHNLWKSILETVEQNQFCGKALIVTCGSHPQNDIEVSQPEHFDLRPDGGCLLPCSVRLKCGHVCPKKCHSNFDSDHFFYECMKECGKVIEKCGHLCKTICSENHSCLNCDVILNKIVEKCGHVIKFRCDKEPIWKDCTFKCEKILECGHLCTKMCREIDCGKCLTQVEVRSTCKHKLNFKVFCSDPVWTYQTKCPFPCNEILQCGHRCLATCGMCFGGRIHQTCSQNCDRLLFCSHKCTIPCSKQCQPCDKKCENECEHSRCPLKCSDPCVPCKEKCKNSCQHSRCSKMCHELCDKKPCNMPCKELLKCGHSCIGLCGELCPEWCRVCDIKKVSEIFFGTEDEPNARFICLKDCGHTLEISGMDNWIYSRFGGDENNNDSANKTIELPNCPMCKTPIRKSKRYSNIIKKQLQSIENIKLKHFGNSYENDEICYDFIVEIKKHFSLKDMKDIDEEFKTAILNKLVKTDKLSFNSLAALKNTWNIYINLKKIEIKNVCKTKSDLEWLNFEIDKILYLLIDKNEISMFREGQKLDDILAECERISSLSELIRLKNLPILNQIEDGQKIEIFLNEAEILLSKNISKFNTNIKQRIEYIFKELGVLLRTSITEEERIMIVEAIQLKQGHWFKCPNGHIYCIGECGGAMQKSICPECKCEIGGQSHRLLETNQLATEMDGATRPAWPTVLNY